MFLVRRGSPDPADDSTAGLCCILETEVNPSGTVGIPATTGVIVFWKTREAGASGKGVPEQSLGTRVNIQTDDLSSNVEATTSRRFGFENGR